MVGKDALSRGYAFFNSKFIPNVGLWEYNGRAKRRALVVSLKNERNVVAEVFLAKERVNRTAPILAIILLHSIMLITT